MQAASGWRWAVILIVAYAALAILARWLASRAMFYPQIASRTAPPGVRMVSLGEGVEVATVYLPNPDATFTIWFFHGNAEALGDLMPFLHLLRDAGYAVLAFDYPGYGVSGGQPSEASALASARAVRAFLREQLGVSPDRTILFGRSLGGGPALQMAVEERFGGVVLQSTFTSVYRVLTRWRMLPFDFFENERKIPLVGCPVLLLHGREDEVIPFHHGEALFAAAHEPKRALWVPNAGHNDFLVAAGKEFWNALREFTALCARSGDARR